MTVQRLPITPNLASQRFRVQLDGRRYQLGLDWCWNPEGWFLSVSDGAGKPLWLRRPVQPDTWLLMGWASAERPPGDFRLVGATELEPLRTVDRAAGIAAEHTISFDAMGRKVGIIYVPADDLRAFIEAL